MENQKQDKASLRKWISSPGVGYGGEGVSTSTTPVLRRYL